MRRFFDYLLKTKGGRRYLAFALAMISSDIIGSMVFGVISFYDSAIGIVGLLFGFAVFITLSLQRESVMASRRMPVGKSSVLGAVILFLCMSNGEFIATYTLNAVLSGRNIRLLAETTKQPMIMPASKLLKLTEDKTILPGDVCKTICFTKRSEMDAVKALKDGDVSVSMIPTSTDNQPVVSVKSGEKAIALVTVSVGALSSLPLPKSTRKAN